MIQLKGRIPSPIHIHGKIGKALPTFTVTFKDGNTVLPQTQVKQGKTATYNGTVPAKDGNEFLGWVLSEPSNDIVDTDTFGGTIYQQITNVTEDITCWAVYSDKRIIHDSWDVISQRSQAGTARDYYNVGDMKRIHLEGTIIKYSPIININVYAYIIGFDHNSTVEGSGITFGLFKDAAEYENSALIDIYYNSVGGGKRFNMNHSFTYTNTGGWSNCDLRYDVLGSTDVREGNPTQNCTATPVENTYMSCLPSDLRTVMKPIIKYTDNVGNSSTGAAAVTATIDYLPLLSEYEVFGTSNYANQNEKSKQAQYDFFKESTNRVMYSSNGTFTSSNTANWWLRSPHRRNDEEFCMVNSTAGNDALGAGLSEGLVPIMLI